MVADILSRICGGAILAAGGWGLGDTIADIWAGPQQWIPLVSGLTTAGCIIGLTATPYFTLRLSRSIAEQTRSIPTSRLLSSLIGLVAGLLIALLISIPLSRIPGWFGVGLPIGLSLLLAYLGASLLYSPNRDIFQRFIQDDPSDKTLDVPSVQNNGVAGPMLLDTSAIIDGRVASISKTGFLQGTVLIPRFILDELRHVADSSDSLRRTRGRRGLELLQEIRGAQDVNTEVIEIDYPNAEDVDAKLVGLAKELGASILTTDFNLNRVAQIDGITVLNVNELANSLRPVVIPGESLTLKILHEGREPGQGVGFLDDGTMVVVDSGADFVGRELNITVARVLQTAAGCMIFAQRA